MATSRTTNGNGHQFLEATSADGAPELSPDGVIVPERSEVFTGYVVGSALMLAAALVAAIWGVDAERKSLEHVAAPLSAMGEE